MKKIILILAMTMLLTACGHTHTAAGWEANVTDHWKLCECGENFEIAEHTIDEDNRCTGCGAEILTGEESADVSVFNEKGDVIACSVYDAEGNITLDVRNEYTYDESGNAASVTRYENGVLMQEAVFKNGKCHVVTSWQEDGGKEVSTFDDWGNIVSTLYYSADGSVKSQVQTEYARNDVGHWYAVKVTETACDGSVSVHALNAHGDETAATILDPEGNVERSERYEITYTPAGNHETRMTYSGDVLIREEIFLFVTDEHGWSNFPGTVIDYHEDGTRTVTTFDETGAQVSQIHYDANGNEIE